MQGVQKVMRRKHEGIVHVCEWCSAGGAQGAYTRSFCLYLVTQEGCGALLVKSRSLGGDKLLLQGNYRQAVLYR